MDVQNTGAPHTEVQHKPEEGRFVLVVNGHEAELLYRRLENNVLDYHHTFVPSELRGVGAGGKVVRAALEFARDEGYTIRSTCSFVQAYLKRHPEFQEIVAL